jgi:hypothetical protein
MRVVDHPAGRVLLCQFCSAVRRVSRAHRLAAGS